MASVLDTLVGNPPTEFGGQRATNRLNYQKDWTFSLLLKLHVEQQDYLVICDYHDDVLVLNGSTNPTRIDFYQIKSSQKKTWSITALLAQEKGKSGALLPSVMGKIYGHRLRFSAVAGLSHFVSSQPFSITLADPPPCGERTSFTAKELHKDEQQEILTKLRNELKLSADPILDASLIFAVSDLSVRGHDKQVKGQLSDFLESRDPSRPYSIGPLYRVIADHIEKCIGHEAACTNVVDLLALKSISRGGFEEMIIDCLEQTERVDLGKLNRDYENILREEQVVVLAARRMRKAFERFQLERLDRAKLNLHKLTDCMHTFHQQNRQQLGTKLLPYLQLGLSVARGKGFTEPEDEAVMAALAWEVLTDEGPVSPADPQPSEQTP